MFKIFAIFITALLSFSLTGCGGSTPQPASKSSADMPSWYLSEVPRDSINFYGVGEGSTKESAKSKALAQISGVISTTVESAMEMSASDSTENGYSEESKSNIKSSTDSIKFTGITVIDTAYVNGQFYTFLKVDREVLFNALKSNLDNDYNKVLRLENQMQSKGTFEVLKNSTKVKKLVDNILSKPTIEILKSVKPQFDSSEYRNKVVTIKNNLDNTKADAVVYLKSRNTLASYYKDILKKYISSYGLTIVNSVNKVSDKSNLLVIDVQANAQKKNVKTSDPRLKGASFADVTVVLTTKNYKGKIVAQNRVGVINISKDGLEAAYIKTKKFERKIKNEGILNILLKTTI